MTVAELEAPVEYRASYALGAVALLRDEYSNAASWAYEAHRALALGDLVSLGIADPATLIDAWVTSQDNPHLAFARLSRAVFEAIQ